MAKHLTDKDILNIVYLIDEWDIDHKLSWDNLCQFAEKKLSINPTRQTLQKFTRIKEAFNNKKIALKTGKEKPKTPPSLKIAQNRIERLEEENARLKREQTALLAQFMVWQYNAYSRNISMEELNRPMPAKRK